MNTTTKNRNVAPDAPWLGVVKAQVESMRYGVVQIVVHEARVVQIERTEKVRLSQLSPSTPTLTGHPEAT